MLAFEGLLVATVLDKNVLTFNEEYGELGGGETLSNLAEEVVGFRWNDAEEGYRAQLAVETRALVLELLAGTAIVVLILTVDLHVVLAEGVDVPDTDIVAYGIYEGTVSRG